MALGYDVGIRNAQLQAVADAINAGSGAGLLRIYTATRPATGAAITTQTLLAELTFSDPIETSITGGVLTANTITQDSSANNSGTASWFRIVTSAGTFVMDGSVGTSGADLNLNTTAITSGVPVSVTSFIITAGNA